MLISAINALTLSPALCAVFLRHATAERRGIMGRVLRGIDHVRDGYAAHRAPAGARGDPRRSLLVARVRRRHLSACRCVTPTGFLPEEDQGAFFIAVQLPDGASVARTEAVAAQVEKHRCTRMPQVQDMLSIVGFSLLDGANEPNAAFIVAQAEAVRRPHRRPASR